MALDSSTVRLLSQLAEGDGKPCSHIPVTFLGEIRTPER